MRYYDAEYSTYKNDGQKVCLSVKILITPRVKYYGCLTFIPFSVKASINSACFSTEQLLYWFMHKPTVRKALLQTKVTLYADVLIRINLRTFSVCEV